MDVIIIAGMPASGKSTIAKQISQVLKYPILEKDAFKEELFDTIGFTNYAQKRNLDHAATAVLLRCMDALLQGGTSCIVVNNFRKDAKAKVQAIIDRYQCRCILVFLSGDNNEFYRRYVERDNKHLRHLGHILQERYPPAVGDSLDYTMTREEFSAKFENLGMTEFELGGTRIDVDATNLKDIDVDALIEKIQKAINYTD